MGASQGRLRPEFTAAAGAAGFLPRLDPDREG